MTYADLKSERELPVVLANGQGVITDLNDRFEEVFGWTKESIVGQPLSVIIPPNLRDAHHLGFSRFLSTGKGTLLDQPLRLKIVTRAGEILNAEHHIVASQVDGQWVFGATIKPLDTE